MAVKTPDAIVSILRIISGAWRQRYVILLPALIMPVLAVLIGLQANKQWSTYTTILIQESAKMNPFLEDLSVSTNLEKRIKTLETLLHSRHMLLRVGYELGAISTDDAAYVQDEYVRKLSASLSVMLIGEDLVKITHTSNDREGLDATLAVVSEQFLDRVLAPEMATLKASEQFLKKQLDERREELRAAERKLADFKEQNASALPNLQGTNAVRLGDLKKLLEQQKIKLSGAIAAKSSIRTRLAQVDPVMNNLEREISDIKAQLALYKGKYTDKHSKVQTAIYKLKRLEDERNKQSKMNLALNDDDLDRLWEMVSTQSYQGIESNELLISQLKELQLSEGKVQTIKQEIESIIDQITVIESNVKNVGVVERELLDIERDLNVKRTLYDELLERFEKATVTGALGRFEQPERIKVIDQPYMPSSPDNLPMIVFLIAGLFAGLGLGIGVALIIEYSDTSVRYIEDLELISGVSVVTRIPRIH